MSANSEWLAAYEAQKAAVLQKMNSSKSSAENPINASSSSVTGTSQFSGLVDVDHVKHLSKSTQVTKLMNHLKKNNDHKRSDSETLSKNISSKSNFVTPGTVCQAETARAVIQDYRREIVPMVCGNQIAVSSKNFAEATPANSELKETPPIVTESNKKSKKRKNGEDKVDIKSIFKHVKSDASRSSSDWHQEYEKRKQAALANIDSGQAATRIGSLSAFHAGPLAPESLSAKTALKPATPSKPERNLVTTQSTSGPSAESSKQERNYLTTKPISGLPPAVYPIRPTRCHLNQRSSLSCQTAPLENLLRQPPPPPPLSSCPPASYSSQYSQQYWHANQTYANQGSGMSGNGRSGYSNYGWARGDPSRSYESDQHRWNY